MVFFRGPSKRGPLSRGSTEAKAGHQIDHRHLGALLHVIGHHSPLFIGNHHVLLPREVASKQVCVPRCQPQQTKSPCNVPLADEHLNTGEPAFLPQDSPGNLLMSRL